MQLEKLSSALKNIENYLDLCFTSIELSKELTIVNIEADENNWETPEETKIDTLTLGCKFYDCEYMLFVPKKAITENDSFFITSEGDSKLFESFNSIMQEDYFEHIKLIFNRFEELLIKENLE